MTEPIGGADGAREAGDAGRLLAVCISRGERLDLGDRVVTTGIGKRPVEGRARVGTLGVADDVISEASHGGADQALYAYGQDDAEYWVEELGQDLPAGAFGENLRISGIDPSRALVGERWSVGDEVVVEATAPRIPCRTLAAARGVDDLVPRFLAAGRPGCYLRVVVEGRIGAGDRIRVLSRPDHGITVAEVSRIQTRDRDEAERLVALEGLAARTRAWAERHLATSGQPV